MGYGSSFGGNPIRQHIGVGDATSISQIEITWPTPKTMQRFNNVGMDAAYHIKEDSPELTPVSYKKFALKHGARRARSKCTEPSRSMCSSEGQYPPQRNRGTEENWAKSAADCAGAARIKPGH